MYDIIISIMQFEYTSYMRHLRVCLLYTSLLSSAVKRQFQLQVAEVFPLFSSVPKMKSLSEELAHTPLSTKHDSSDICQQKTALPSLVSSSTSGHGTSFPS